MGSAEDRFRASLWCGGLEVGLLGVPLLSVAFVHPGHVLTQMGASKQNRGKAVWALHSHGARAHWIRLMVAHEGALHCGPL